MPIPTAEEWLNDGSGRDPNAETCYALTLEEVQARDRDVRLDERRKHAMEPGDLRTTPQALAGMIAACKRASYRDGLEDATKARCLSCKENIPYLDALGMHTRFEGRHAVCLASEIRSLIAKLDAEVKHGG